nr:MAG TPA: hypothetical protein [Caudoviricetes sp.]
MGCHSFPVSLLSSPPSLRPKRPEAAGTFSSALRATFAKSRPSAERHDGTLGARIRRLLFRARSKSKLSDHKVAHLHEVLQRQLADLRVGQAAHARDVRAKDLRFFKHATATFRIDHRGHHRPQADVVTRLDVAKSHFRSAVDFLGKFDRQSHVLAPLTGLAGKIKGCFNRFGHRRCAADKGVGKRENSAVSELDADRHCRGVTDPLEICLVRDLHRALHVRGDGLLVVADDFVADHDVGTVLGGKRDREGSLGRDRCPVDRHVGGARLTSKSHGWISLILKTELDQHRKDAQLVHKIGREQDIQAVRIRGVALNDDVALESVHVLDQARFHQIGVSRDELGLDDRRRHNRLAFAESRPVVRQLVATIFGRDSSAQEADDVAQRMQGFRILIGVVRCTVSVLDVGRHCALDLRVACGIAESGHARCQKVFAFRAREAITDSGRRDARQHKRLEGTSRIGLHRNCDLANCSTQAIKSEIRIRLRDCEHRQVRVVLGLADFEQIFDRATRGAVDMAVELHVVRPALSHGGLGGIQTGLVGVGKRDDLEGFFLERRKSFFDVRNTGSGSTVCNCHAHACRQFLPIGCAQKIDIDRQVVTDHTFVLGRYRHNAKRSLSSHGQLDVRIDRGRDVTSDVRLGFACLDADLNELIAYIKTDCASGSSRAGNRHGLGRSNTACRIR